LAFTAAAWATETPKSAVSPPPKAKAVAAKAASQQAPAKAVASPATPAVKITPHVANAIWADKAVAAKKPAAPAQIAAKPALAVHIAEKPAVAVPAVTKPSAAPAVPKAATAAQTAAKPAAPAPVAIKPVAKPAPAPTHVAVAPVSAAPTKPATAPAVPAPAKKTPVAAAPITPRIRVAGSAPSPTDQWVRVAAQRVASDAAAVRPGTATATALRPPDPNAPDPGRAGLPPVRRVMTLRIGESQVLNFDRLTRAAIGNEAIADIAVLSGNQILVNGKATGATTLLVWDRRGQNTFELTVVPEVQNVQALAGVIRRDVDNPNIQVRAVGNAVFLEGTVSSAAERDRAEAIATAHYTNVRNLVQVQAPQVAVVPPPPAPPKRVAADVVRDLTQAMGNSRVTIRPLNPNTVVVEGSVTQPEAERARKIIEAVAAGFPVLELLQVGPATLRQVLVRARVIEINKVKSKELGVQWLDFLTGGGDTGLNISETRPSPIPLDRLGPFRRIDPLDVQIRAMQQNGYGRVLAEPNLMVLEGQEGTILIGGEIPIPVPQQGTGNGSTVTIDYKPFGVQLGLKPTSITDDSITLGVAPEVSTLDFSNGVNVNGFRIPAISTRRASSVVTLRPNQTIAIGGLIRNDVTQTIDAVPGLSKIPILGELFKSRNFQRNETELVILITPQTLRPGEQPAGIPIPNVPVNHPFQDKDATERTPGMK
jgi:pilus assembly protein CpaC